MSFIDMEGEYLQMFKELECMERVLEEGKTLFFSQNLEWLSLINSRNFVVRCFAWGTGELKMGGKYYQ